MDYESGLQKIREARNKMHWPHTPIYFVLAVLVGVVFPVIAPFAMLVVCVYAYIKLVSVARLPCPRCKEPYGTNARVVLGVGTDRCSNCDFPLHQ